MSASEGEKKNKYYEILSHYTYVSIHESDFPKK